MSNKILLKRSDVPNAVPLTANVSLGELAINTNDGKLYTKIDNGVDVQIFELTQNQLITLGGDVTGNGTSNISVALNASQPNITAVGNLTALTVVGNINGSNVVLTGDLTSNNISTAANIVAAGNITGEFLIANTAIIANVQFDDVVTNNITASGFANVTGNVTGGNLITIGNVDATGNIAGDFFIGNGRFLSGIDTTLISNGATEVRTYENGNVTFTINGVGNVVLVTSNGITVVGNVDSGNVNTTTVSATTAVVTGNITGGNLITAGLTSTATLTASGNANVGNLDTSGQVTATGNITGGNLTTAGETQTGSLRTTGDALINGNLTVQGNLTYINIDDLRVQDPIIVLGTGPNGAPLTANDGLDRGTYLEYYTTATGNAFVGFQNSSGNMIIANDVEFASNDVIQINAFGTLQAGNAYLESAEIIGNIDAGNIATGGQLSVTGNLVGGNLATSGQVVATGNVTGGNLITAGLTNSGTLLVTANANVGNLGTAGQVTATGNVTGGNLITAGNLIGLQFQSTSDTLLAPTIGNTAGERVRLYDFANVAKPNYAIGVETSAIWMGVDTNLEGQGFKWYGNTTPIARLSGVGNLTISGNLVANSNITGANLNTTGVTSSGTLSVTGDANVGNLGTAGFVVATGNITGGNFLTSGLISAVGTITSVGNVSGGNLLTGGLIQAVGNITGGNVNTAGQVVAIGNITGGNIISVGNASVTGNITVGGILTDDYYYANGAPVDFQQAAGSNTQIQFNLDDDFGASANFTFDSDTNLLTVAGNISVGNIDVSSTGDIATLTVDTFANITATTTASSNITGALRVAGGVGIIGNVYAGDMYSNDELVLTVESTIDGGIY